jgi:hypothetical protein
MTYIDVMIPAIGGLILVAAPRLFVKPSGDVTADHRSVARMRKIGVLLLVVAVGYLLIKVAQGSFAAGVRSSSG